MLREHSHNKLTYIINTKKWKWFFHQLSILRKSQAIYFVSLYWWSQCDVLTIDWILSFFSCCCAFCHANRELDRLLLWNSFRTIIRTHIKTSSYDTNRMIISNAFTNDFSNAFTNAHQNVVDKTHFERIFSSTFEVHVYELRIKIAAIKSLLIFSINFFFMFEVMSFSFRKRFLSQIESFEHDNESHVVDRLTETIRWFIFHQTVDHAIKRSVFTNQFSGDVSVTVG